MPRDLAQGGFGQTGRKLNHPGLFVIDQVLLAKSPHASLGQAGVAWDDDELDGLTAFGIRQANANAVLNAVKLHPTAQSLRDRH